jgi:acyl-CoA thioester hydrolase
LFVREIVVRFSECDGLGHVNNGTYFDYMEDARIDVFRLLNPSLDLHTWNMIVAATRCDFLQQVTFAETLTVYTWFSKIGNSSFLVEHALCNAQGDFVARGQATMLAYDYETKKAKPLWDEVRQQFEAHRIAPEGTPGIR